MFFSKSKTNAYRWEYLRDSETFNQLLSATNEKPLVIFKHSTRCPISSMALDRFNDYVTEIAELATVVMIDVIENRPVSLHVADALNVMHQSPQVLVLHQEQAVYDNSHSGIQGKVLLEFIQKLSHG
jgi:bacillithiol system protein YtxJ